MRFFWARWTVECIRVLICGVSRPGLLCMQFVFPMNRRMGGLCERKSGFSNDTRPFLITADGCQEVRRETTLVEYHRIIGKIFPVPDWFWRGKRDRLEITAGLTVPIERTSSAHLKGLQSACCSSNQEHLIAMITAWCILILSSKFLTFRNREVSSCVKLCLHNCFW